MDGDRSPPGSSSYIARLTDPHRSSHSPPSPNIHLTPGEHHPQRWDSSGPRLLLVGIYPLVIRKWGTLQWTGATRAEKEAQMLSGKQRGEVSKGGKCRGSLRWSLHTLAFLAIVRWYPLFGHTQLLWSGDLRVAWQPVTRSIHLLVRRLGAAIQAAPCHVLQAGRASSSETSKSCTR